MLTLWTGLRERMPLDRALAVLCVMFGVVTILSFWLMQQIPFDPFKVSLDRRQLFFTPLYYLILSVPFFCSGLAIALCSLAARRRSIGCTRPICWARGSVARPSPR